MRVRIGNVYMGLWAAMIVGPLYLMVIGLLLPFKLLIEAADRRQRQRTYARARDAQVEAIGRAVARNLVNPPRAAPSLPRPALPAPPRPDVHH